MDFRTGPIRDAARARDYGRVIKLVRMGRRMTQSALGHAVGLSQSAVSRLERRGTASYSTAVLAAVAAHLQIPPVLVGLAGSGTSQAQARSDDDQMHRRSLLTGTLAALAASVTQTAPAAHDTLGDKAAALRMTTSAYRRLDGTTPARELADAVEGHLRLIQTISRNANGDADRARLAAAGSEASSFAGWLAWDRGDLGSARSWYGAAVKAARTSQNPLLAAYQDGTLAQFEAYHGNGAKALSLVRRARRELGPHQPAVADAWLSSVEALGHAAAGDTHRADRALTASRAVAETLAAQQQQPPWPWVFSFTPDKVAACRVTCGARLGLPSWVLGEDVTALATGHAKQRALLTLEIAAGHLASGRLDGAFALASAALDIGLQYRSGRIVERARALRRSLTTSSPPRAVRDFDERLRDVYL